MTLLQNYYIGDITRLQGSGSVLTMHTQTTLPPEIKTPTWMILDGYQPGEIRYFFGPVRARD